MNINSIKFGINEIPIDRCEYFVLTSNGKVEDAIYKSDDTTDEIASISLGAYQKNIFSKEEKPDGEYLQGFWVDRNNKWDYFPRKSVMGWKIKKELFIKNDIDLRELLWPIESSEINLVRVGSGGDGGYVFPQNQIKKCDVVYSYGIGGDITMDEAFAKMGKTVRCYDHTISKLPREVNGCCFYKEGLSGFPQKDCNNFFAHVIQNGDGDKNIILKIDIEHHEYDFFRNFDGDKSRILAMAIEFHLFHSRHRDHRFIFAIKDVLKDFYIVHHHGNNGGSLFNWNGFRYPFLSEISFINKNQVLAVKRKFVKYPLSKLDFNNNSNKSAVEIDFT